MAAKESKGLEITSPLFLHPSETQFSLDEKLQGISNYRTWRRSMELALAARRKLGFVTGQVKREEQEDKNKPIWDTCNNVVLC